MSTVAISLQSGSSGNCIFVEANGVRLLVDAGISGKQAELRLAHHGIDIRSVHGVLITHEHADHVSCAHVYQKKFHLPLYATGKTWAAMQRYRSASAHGEVRLFSAGETLKIGALRVETLSTPHDAVDGVAYVIDAGSRRLGVLTDLGHVFTELGPAVASLDGVFLESNYDPDMLETGDYPMALKRRIRGPAGHLSNLESANVLKAHGKRLLWACLAHLSQNNNTPRIALHTHREHGKHPFPVHAARRDSVTDALVL
ncbi:MAG: MBL fold metallo-hydrolase [Deltaproteobacteria bacterium]|nr:MBL fold metallo-hydrolase [Deltaproteobacteria bacterium]